MHKKYFVIAILGVIFLFYLFYILGTTKIIIHFEDLEPLKGHLPVYYNGFKLGHTTKIYPDKDYQSMLVVARVVLKNLVLPANTSAILRRKDKKDYIELEYPSKPYIQKLSNNDVIEGHLGINFEKFIQDQAETGGLDEIKANVNSTISSAGDTFDALTEMIQVLTSILKDVKPIIHNTADNINLTSKNLAYSSSKIKDSIDKGYIDNTLNNIQQTSGNLVLTTQNFNGFSTNLNQQSIKLTNCLLENLNIVVKNINEIVIGIGNTLKKKFGGLRLIFGSVNS